MKIKIWTILFFCLPIFSFSQSGTWNTLLHQLAQPKSGAQSPAQDSTKPKQTGTQSNLAVSDEGTPSNTKTNSPQSNEPSDKSEKSDKKTSINPIGNLKNKLTKAATQNNNNSGTTSNLAVSDEGTPSDKSEKGKTQASETNNKSPNPNQGNTSTVVSPK